MSEEKIPLGEIPTPSTAITSDVLTAFDGRQFSLRFEYDREGEFFVAGLLFDRVRSIRWTAENYCTASQIEGAYDTLVELRRSQWIMELRARALDDWGQNLRHFMLFLDSAGCYEVAAESYDLLAEERLARIRPS